MEKKTVEQILEDFIQANQQVYSDLEALDLTLEAIEIVLVPIQRMMTVRIKEFSGNSLKEHRRERGLYMKSTDFDTHVRKTLPPGASLRHANMRNLNPDKVDKLLAENRTIEEETQVEKEIK